MEPWLRIKLEGPPQGKGRARSFRKVRHRVVGNHVVADVGIGHHTPDKTKAYERALAMEAKVAMLKLRRRMIPRDRHCVVVIWAWFEMPEDWTEEERHYGRIGRVRPVCKPDWDNIAKVTDALNRVVWVDDAQVADGHVKKFYSDQSSLIVEVFYDEEARGGGL